MTAYPCAQQDACNWLPRLHCVMQAGEALSAFLPDHVGQDSFKSNYSQAFIPGLVTALRGIRYEPCLLRSAALGAGISAAGVVVNPELFATRPTGAGLLPYSSLLFSVNTALAAVRRSNENQAHARSISPEEASTSKHAQTCRISDLQEHHLQATGYPYQPLIPSNRLSQDELLTARSCKYQLCEDVWVTDSLCACAAVVATGLRIRPALLVVEPTAAAGVAIGGLVVRPCPSSSSNPSHTNAVSPAAEGDACRWWSSVLWS